MVETNHWDVSIKKSVKILLMGTVGATNFLFSLLVLNISVIVKMPQVSSCQILKSAVVRNQFVKVDFFITTRKLLKSVLTVEPTILRYSCHRMPG